MHLHTACSGTVITALFLVAKPGSSQYVLQSVCLTMQHSAVSDKNGAALDAILTSVVPVWKGRGVWSSSNFMVLWSKQSLYTWKIQDEDRRSDGHAKSRIWGQGDYSGWCNHGLHESLGHVRSSSTSNQWYGIKHKNNFIGHWPTGWKIMEYLALQYSDKKEIL